ncbi:hypothetical protein P5P86_19895 [Nocardioides sp. BP30]|uniref:hypothetical protein n=1 Tax=Nocardioides sp. BP30 TaxID=3036374 RepID=UPI002468FDDD|nr:hypothetical protein [Nocardioides sp. BP30]WGL52201.1 hypothetical protein P5P86_19895 [Nocardioides sp. BP30]
MNLPRPVKGERRHLTHTQVGRLAYTGVRFGEMAALKVRRHDLSLRRAVIAESVTPVQGKGWAGRTEASRP